MHGRQEAVGKVRVVTATARSRTSTRMPGFVALGTNGRGRTDLNRDAQPRYMHMLGSDGVGLQYRDEEVFYSVCLYSLARIDRYVDFVFC